METRMIRSIVRKRRFWLAATLLFAVLCASGCADKADNPDRFNSVFAELLINDGNNFFNIQLTLIVIKRA